MFWNSNFQTHHTEKRLRGKAGGGGGWARWLLSTDSLLRAWTALGTALNGSWGALVIIPGGRLPFPTVSLKLLAPPPTLPPPWKLFHLLTGPLLATWCPLPGPRSWLVCLCILFSFFTPPPFSFPLSPRSPSTTRTTPLSPPSSFRPPFSSFLSRHPSPKPSTTSFTTSFQFLSTFSFFFHRSSSLLPSIQIGMLPRVRPRARPIRSRLWRSCYGGRGFPPLLKRIRIFELGFLFFFFFGSVPMNFCEPGFGSIPVGEVSIKFTGINVIPRVSKDRPPWVLGDWKFRSLSRWRLDRAWSVDSVERTRNNNN